MNRKIYLIRHEETEDGEVKRYRGHTDCKLSKRGIKEAKQLAYIFQESGIIINSIFSSDLIRCKSTVDIAFPKGKVTFLKALREINMGDFDGLTFDEVKKKYPGEFIERGENISEYTPLNGESFRQCQERAINIFDYIINSTCGNVAICSHSGFLRALLCSILKLDLKDMFSIKQDYGCINIIRNEESNFM